MADVPWDQDVSEGDNTPVSEWNAFKERLISIAGDKSIGDGFLLLKTGNDADKPSAGYSGRLYFATDTGILYRDNGTSWVAILRAEDAIRLANLQEKDYGSLNNVPSSFTPENHASTHGDSDGDSIDHDNLTGGTASGAHHSKTQPGDIDSANWNDYEIQKNGNDGTGIINFKT